MSSFLVLWDVDYTLVNSAGVGWHLYELAFAELYGRKLPFSASEANMAGRTDLAIARDVLTLAGVPDPDRQVRLFEAALTRLAPGLAGLVAATAAALPGAAAAISSLAGLSGHASEAVLAARHSAADGAAAAEQPLVCQSLLTGNVMALAKVKLEPLGLTAHLDLRVGAYGNESAVRSELVGLARGRASAKYRADFGGEATVVIGDTPRDVAAALAAGARAVGVATGSSTTGELAESGAHAVLADLTDTGQVITAVLGARYQPRPA